MTVDEEDCAHQALLRAWACLPHHPYGHPDYTLEGPLCIAWIGCELSMKSPNGARQLIFFIAFPSAAMSAPGLALSHIAGAWDRRRWCGRRRNGLARKRNRRWLRARRLGPWRRLASHCQTANPAGCSAAGRFPSRFMTIGIELRAPTAKSAQPAAFR
jgi:hypothetical protein